MGGGCRGREGGREVQRGGKSKSGLENDSDEWMRWSLFLLWMAGFDWSAVYFSLVRGHELWCTF